MSAGATSTADAARLSRDLLQRAVVAFATIPDDERGPSLTALDAFLARPGPAAYLAAVRILDEARRHFSLRQLRLSRAGYARARGLDTVRRELGVELAETMAQIPGDERTGLRLRALALLSAAHRELAGRVAGSTEQLRKQLALAQSTTVVAPRRRPPAAARSR